MEKHLERSFCTNQFEVSKIPKRTSATLRVVARVDPLYIYRSFYLIESRAAEFVDQLAAFTLDPVQDVHAVVMAGSKQIHGSLRQRPAKSRFVRHGAVREVTMAETTSRMKGPRMTQGTAVSENTPVEL